MQLISLQENQQSNLFRKTTPFSNTSTSTKSNGYTFPEDHQLGEDCTKDLSVLSKTLKKFIGRALLTQTELHTILKKTEATVNNRPLTYVESDTTPTSPTALTPSHLINGRFLSTLPHLEETEFIIEKDLGQMQANQRLLIVFDTTTAKYLEKMENRVFEFSMRMPKSNKWETSQITATEGDIVSVYVDKPRSTWKMGKIEGLYKEDEEDDGPERSSRVKTQGRDITRAL